MKKFLAKILLVIAAFGVANAPIAEAGLIINSYRFAASYSGPLDSATTNLAVAFSVTHRLLSSYSGPLFTVRRSSDSTTLDIGYKTDGTADTTALLTFVGSGSGYITKLYNQAATGSAFDAAQGTTAQQPRIVNAGTLDDGFYLSSSYWLDIPSTSQVAYTDGTNVQVALRGKMNNGNNLIFGFGTYQISSFLPYGGAIYWDAPYTPGRISVSAPSALYSDYKVTSLERAGSSSTIRFDGTALTTSSVSGTISATSVFRIGANPDASATSIGNLRTFVVWKDCANAATRAALLP